VKIHQDLPSEEVQIQIVPLIDVIFCILTFFILAALQFTRQQSIEVELPAAKTGSPPTRETQMRDMMVVTINPTGLTYIDRDPQPVDRNQLFQRLQDYQQNNPKGLLVLNASRMAFYNDVVQILDMMRAVGGDRVALATIPAEAQPQTGATPAPTIAPTLSPTLSPTPNPFNLNAPSPGSTLNPNQFQLQPPLGQPSPNAGGAAPLPGNSPGAPSNAAP
jgi:biopolymer transport protein ExbD